MGVLENFAYRLGSIRRSYEGGLKGIKNLPRWLERTADVEQYKMPDMTVATNQAELYRRLSWVSIAVKHVSNSFATTPLEVKRIVGEEEESIPNHPFEKLLMRPNPMQSRHELLTDMSMFAMLTGNSYTWLNKANENSEPVEMWTIPANRIYPVPDGKMYIRGYIYDAGDGIEVPLETWEVMHSKLPNPLNRYVGLSPIEALATVAVGDLKMQEWNTNFFAKDNAKAPGILTFKDMIVDSEWEKIKADFKEQYGGTKRNLMMLRGTGDGSVNWVQTAMSQKDMEFLMGREFNKNEIYDMLAPGLTSWLAVNSTEANSKTGRDAFIELAVWPMCVLFQEVITNTILPVYGDNLLAKFDDIRPKDALLKLKQQESFERTHTIAEVRKEQYGDDPLGDERDNLLIAEVGRSSTGSNTIGDVDTNNDGQIDTIEQIEAKAHEREQFRKFASKRAAEGKHEVIDDFKFKYIEYDEQIALKAEYKPKDDKLDRLILAMERFSVPD